MAKYHLSNKALEDLSDIWDYTFEAWSEKQADKYYNIIIKICETLARNPQIGKSYDLITHGLLGFPCEKHIIFYQITSEKEITIIRILHESMDLENLI